MMRKLFALASVTALGGLVAAVGSAGCSSSTASQPAADGGLVSTGTDGATTSKSPTEPPRSDAGSPAEDVPECKAKVTFKPDEVKPPAPRSTTACTPEVIDTLADACTKDPNAQGCTDARAANENKTCADCIFGTKEDDEWKVINLSPGEDPGARYNQEGCVDHLTGVKGCGRAYLGILACYNEFCGTCEQSEVRRCVEVVADGECKDYRISDATCANALSKNEAEVDGCFPPSLDAAGVKSLFVNLSKVACGGGAAKDGGAKD